MTRSLCKAESAMRRWLSDGYAEWKPPPKGIYKWVQKR